MQKMPKENILSQGEPTAVPAAPGKKETERIYHIRPIEPRDNAGVEAVIRACLREFGADHAGTAWADPDLGRFSEVYAPLGSAYWVAEDPEGRIVGGAGIGPLTDTICELQKMYCLPDARGTGIAQGLMDLCLVFAGEHYRACYLETLENMTAAQRFYEKNGFKCSYDYLVDNIGGRNLREVRYVYQFH